MSPIDAIDVCMVNDGHNDTGGQQQARGVHIFLLKQNTTKIEPLVYILR
jgi:hypothetical protein